MNRGSTDAQQEVLDERIVNAMRHFNNELEPLLQALRQSPATTDSTAALGYNTELKALYINLSLKLHLFNYCESGFNIEAFNAGKKNFVPAAPPVNAYAGTQTTKKIDSPHPELYKQLRRLRDKICSEMDAPIYFVAGSATLDEMARYLPQSVHELTQINGFGKVKTT